MDAVALGFSVAAFLMALVAVAGLIWALGEVKGFQKSKYSLMYPGLGDFESQAAAPPVHPTASGPFDANTLNSIYDIDETI